jgi:hypothetical protein
MDPVTLAPADRLREIFNAAGFPGPMKLTSEQLEEIRILYNDIKIKNKEVANA